METGSKTTPFISCAAEAEILVRQLLNIGEAMYRSGGEISRIEDSLRRLAKVYGAEHVSVYALTSDIVVTAEFSDVSSLTQNRRILKREAIDCTRMEKLNQLCRGCAQHPVPVEKLREMVLEILEERQPERKLYLGQLIAAASFTVFFGGALSDIPAALLAVLLICALQRWFRPICSGALVFNVCTSFFTGLFVSLLNLLIPGLHENEILIGVIMILIPGMAITNSIRYILAGDTISSFEKLMDSLLQATGIAAGFMLALLAVPVTILPAAGRSGLSGALVQLLAAGIGTLGFCLVFNQRKPHIPVTVLGGLGCWGLYLLLRGRDVGVFAACFTCAFAVGLYGVCMARMMKVPTTVLFMPACIALVPGSNLYYSALGLLRMDRALLHENIVLLALCAAGISIGLAAAGELEKTVMKIEEIRRRKNR